jgi:CBS domain-containing protein
MSHPVVTCPVEATAEAPARLMWEFDCGFVPLVDQEGRLAGVVTDRDLTMAALTQGRALPDIQVRSAMAREVAAVHDDDEVDAVERLMRDTQVRRLPVIDVDGRPIGIVALNDLARLAARARKAAVDREVVQTLAAIGRPRASLVREAGAPFVQSVAS